MSTNCFSRKTLRRIAQKADHRGDGQLRVAGPVRHQRLLGPRAVRPSEAAHRRHRRRGASGLRGPPGGPAFPLLGPGADTVQSGPISGLFGAQAGRVRPRPAAGSLGTPRGLRDVATAAGSGRSPPRDAGLHPGAAAAGTVLAGTTDGGDRLRAGHRRDRCRSLRTIVEHRSESPVALFPLDRRPHLAHVRVEVTNVSAYQTLFDEVTP